MRVYIVSIVDSRESTWEQQQRMIEMERLTNTYGGLVVVKTIQKKDRPAYRTFVGSGKLEEILQDMILTESDLLIVGNILKSGQIFAINEFFRTHLSMQDHPYKIQAWDKVDLILKIFDKHAQSAEAKLQIQLAAIKHMGPRIFGMGMEMSKQGGSSGGGGGAMRGLGETNTERMRRHLKEETRLIEKKLKKYENMRGMHRERRKKLGLPSFGIVGYTNAGKSSLMNALSKKGVYADDKLFATLGTTVAKVYLPFQTIPSLSDSNEKDVVAGQTGKEVLLIDTIGFIRDLPPQLIKAFASTLEDSIQSDILLHVIDASDPDIAAKVETVENILKEIQAIQTSIYVLNKSDQLSDQKKSELADQLYGKDIVFASALSGEGLDDLKQRMLEIIQTVS